MRFIPVCSIKWPNDIYIKDDKIAGILIESTIIADQIEYSIAGIGFNINQQQFISSAPNPVSLKQITGKSYELKDCLNQLCSDLDKRYKQIIGSPEKLKHEYISKLYRLNEWSEFRDPRSIFTGKILTVGEYGSLKIEIKTGEIKEFAFKEIEFIR